MGGKDAGGGEQGTVIAALLTGAIVWGLVWYPYRELEWAGYSPTTATILTYAASMVLLALLPRGSLAGWRQNWWPLLLIGLAAGWTNLAYVLGMVGGEVMRVLLLFYLAPLWTVVLSRLLLGEQLTPASGLLVLLSLAGALVMLWPAQGLPLPANAAEWLGLSAGVSFALVNVLSRRAQATSIELKSLATWLGVLAVSAAWLAVGGGRWSMPAQPALTDLLLLAILGLTLGSITVIIQYGLARVPANTAIVIFLVELVAGAVSAALLAGEYLGLRDWIGGSLIVSASLVAAWRSRRRRA